MSNVVNLGSLPSNESGVLDIQRALLEKEVLSLSKSIDTNNFLIEELKNNIVNLKKSKIVVSLNEYRKILNELTYLNNNLVVLKQVYEKNSSSLQGFKKTSQEKEGKLIKLPIKKTKRRRYSKKDSL